MKNRFSHRILSAILCFSLLLPNFTGIVTATSTPEDRAVRTNSKWVPVSDPFASGEIPGYTTKGTVSAEALEYDCGNGISNDGAKSYMKLVKDTSATEMITYVSVLQKAGFVRTSSQILLADAAGNNNIFYRFLSPNKNYVLTVYYLHFYKEVRIIVDTAEDMVQSFAGGFVYQSTTNEVAQTMMTMYGLSMSPNGYDNTSKSPYRTGARNCGALIVIRMPDNSLFINDGGDIEQWSDEICEDFMKFCRELTGKREGEKVVINTWFLSHAHTDHFDGIPRFFERYHESIDIQNVMYNIDDERLGTTRDISAVMQMVNGYFPNVKYYKLHTGDHFDIAGVQFDVLYTQEDRFAHNSENKMVIDIRDGDETNSNENRDGTYRPFLYEDYEKTKIVNFSDFNDTSAVLKVTFPEGITKGSAVSSILYGDVNLADQVMIDIWLASTLETDIMMVPHHGHDAHPELVAMSNAKIFMYTQVKSAIYGPNGIVDDKVDLAGTYRPALVENFLAMHDIDGKKYFDTTATRKTYWEGTETACILFGENIDFENMPSGLTRDSTDPSGFTVYTMDAPFFEYGGWTSISSVHEGSSATATKQTNSNSVHATGVEIVSDGTKHNTLTEGALYLIVHNKTNQVLNYDAVVYDASAGIKHPEVGHSIAIGAKTDGAQVYFNTVNGKLQDDVIYFSNDRRDDFLWELDFTQFNGTNMNYNTGSPTLGGNAEEFYYRSMFLKGISSAAAPFWSTTEETADDTFRVLQPNTDYVFRTPTDTLNDSSNGVSYNIRIEFFANNSTTDTDGDGVIDSCDTCVIYYSSGSSYRVLTVDADGHWIRKDYSSASALKADIENVKLRLYRYETGSDKRTITVTGSSVYEVLKKTSASTVAYRIEDCLRVTDNAGLNIACSGRTAKVGYYWLDMSGYNGTNDCSVAVKYRNDDGTDTVLTTVTVKMQDYFDMLSAYNDDDTVYSGTRYGSKFGFMYLDEGVIYEEVVEHANRMDMTVTVHDAVNGVITDVVNITPSMLRDHNGNTVNLNTPGEYTNLSLVYNGKVVDTGLNILVAPTAYALSYPEAGTPGSVTVNKQGLTAPSDFMATGIANIQLSATGVPEPRGVDLLIVMDLSGSMKNGLDTNVDALPGQQSRIHAMEESLKSIVQELQGSGRDIRIAMSDFGDVDHYTFGNSVSDESIRERAYYDITISGTINNDFEFYNHLNWVISDNDPLAGSFSLVGHKFNPAHSQYTGVVTPEVYTGSKVVNAGAFVNVNSLTDSVMNGIIDKMNQNVNKALGTNYDIGLEYAYRLGHAIRKENVSNGEDRDIVCIFMSDGAAMQYNYFSGNAQSQGWSEYLMGIPEDITSLSEYYSDQANWPEQIEQISKVLLNLLVTEETATTQHLRDYSLLKAPLYRNQSISDRYPEFNDRYFVYNPNLTRENALYFYTYMDDQGYPLYNWEFLYRLAVANGYEDHIGEKFTPELYHSSQENKILQYLVNLLTTPQGDIIYKVDAQGNPVYEKDSKGNIIYKEDQNGVLQPVQVTYFQSRLANPFYRDLGRYEYSDTANAVFAAEKYYLRSNIVIDNTKSYTDQFFAAMKSIGVDCDWNLFARIAEVNKNSLKNEYGYLQPRDGFRELIDAIKTPVQGMGDYQTLSPYHYFYNAEGKNWWAEAMKGDPNQLYPVINKYALEDNPAWSNAYYGDVRNCFSTGSGLALDGQEYISGFAGLDMDLYTVSFSISDDILLTTEVAETVLENVASGPNYFFSASTQDDLTEVLQVITSTMTTAATRAWFTDTMGPDFKLSTDKTVMSHDGVLVTVNPNPSIRVMEYDVVQENGSDGKVTYRRVGEPRVIETVTFEDLDGDGDIDAWSDQVYTTSEVGGVIIHQKVDIWDERTGLISGKNFYYNANTDKSVNISFGSQGKYPLAPETFFWVIGVIGRTEMVLDYQVYLTGSIEGERFLTSSDYYHATNTNAVLNYINYLGQNCQQDTISPEYPWGDARVGVAYYLVNENGQMIADQTTGATTTDFAQSVKLTRPMYEYLIWNDANTQASGSVAASEHRPGGYSLYSPTASYGVSLNWDGSGGWTISDSTKTTYVVSNDGTFNAGRNFAADSYNTGSTVVWFAVVVYEPTTAPDTVVIDYGLPVDIDVMGNDVMFGSKGTLAALGNYSSDIAFSGIILKSGYAVGTYQGEYGNARIENGKVHYQPASMEMNGVEKLNYAVYYTPGAGEGAEHRGYHYNTITVIPATSIYYEDSFALFQTYVYNSSSFKYVVTNEDRWTKVTDEYYADAQGAHQQEDRPGIMSLPEFDADNLYGYDEAYANCAKYSLGSAMKFTADSAYAGTVTFSFYGTGFDVVSLTSSNTGTIMVDVYDAETYVQDQSRSLHSYSVDTYYGYTYDQENDDWIITTTEEALYQVPVMKVNGLDYGHYTAVITVAYADFFDHNKSDASYDFYMDAVRIYDPAGNDETAGGAYTEDGEFGPVYEELRNVLISERDFFDSTAQLGDGFIPGAVFIDGIPTLDKDHYDITFKKDPPEIGTYLNFGPNNEVYLAPGQAIAFELTGVDALKAAHLAMKSTGGTAKIKVFRASTNIIDASTWEIATATDRYYDLTALAGDTVIIANVGSQSDGILSITNIKLTTDPNAETALSVSDVVTISKRSAQRALDALTARVEGGMIPGTGDVDTAMMNSLVLLACLCMTAIVVLIAMDRRVARASKMR